MDGWPSLRSGDKHRNVRTLQHLLNHHGSSIAVDGEFGPETEAALKRFQSEDGLEPDGVVGAPVWLRLIARVSMGDAGEAVKAAQVQLLYRRTLPDVDGVFGVKTDISLRRLQVLKRLPADGTVSAETWREMLADQSLPGDAAAGGDEVDPADWRAQLLAKLRPGYQPGEGRPF
ncbi:MAG: peptidoglycan-binding protein [Actinomycetota bacterium]